MYGCRLLRCLYNILYFLWLYDEFFIILYNILKIAELDCCQIIILSIHTIYTVDDLHTLRHMSYICVCLSLDFPYETSIGACVESKICSLDRGLPLSSEHIFYSKQAPVRQGNTSTIEAIYLYSWCGRVVKGDERWTLNFTRYV